MTRPLSTITVISSVDKSTTRGRKLYPDITLDIYEGPSNVCPLDTGTLQVTVGTQTLPELSISDGKANDFILKGGFPNFNSPYSINMTVSAQNILNQNSEIVEQSFITSGSKSKGTDFLSLSSELPFLVLHDPPTDGAQHFEKVLEAPVPLLLPSQIQVMAEDIILH